MTYPVARRLNTLLAGFPARDGWQYTWWLWFAKQLLLDGRGLADLHLLNHPAGLQHPYQWSLAYLSLIAVALESLFSPVTTFNLMVLTSFVLSGLSAYHLCRALTGSHWAAMVGGAIFAFAPNRLGHAMAGWLPQMTVYVYPWYALSLIRALRRPTVRRGIGLGVLAGVGATVYVMHIAYSLVPLTLVVAGAELIRLRGDFFEKRRARSLGLASGIAILIALPPLLPLVMARFQGDASYLSTTGVVGHSTDLLAFFTPSPYHPVLAPLGLVPSFARQVFADREALRAGSAYLGVLPLLLGGWGLLRSKPRPWRWGVLALGAAVLSLGPILVVGGEPVQHTADGLQGSVLLPYALVRQIPFLDWGRTPGRLNAVGMLGLGVLAAHGMSSAVAYFDISGRKRGLLSGAVLALILFEFLPLWPFPTGDAGVPPVIQHIAGQPGDGALLHIPMKRRRVNHRALFFQTAVDQPIVGGEVLRMLPETPPWWKTIEGLVQAGATRDSVPRPNESQRRAWLRHFGVDWVLLHLLESSDEARYRPSLERLLGPAVVEDETLAAFSVPEGVAPLDSQRLYTFDESDWRHAEQDGETWRRWMDAKGKLYVYSTREESGSLRFTVSSYLDFPLLEIYEGEQLLDTFVVGERTTYATQPFTLKEGMNVLRFHAPAGCPEVLDDPRCWGEALLGPPEDDATPPCDARTTCRTFVFDHVSFVPAGELAPDQSLGVTFGHQIRLRGWSLDATNLHPGDTLTATLAWEAIVKPSDRHVVFVHLLSADGELVAQHDDAPVGNVVPRSAWPAGATFKYPVSIRLPDDLPEGRCRVLVGVYLWPSLKRLDLPGNVENAFELGAVRISP
jgi:hypothetical protein